MCGDNEQCLLWCCISLKVEVSNFELAFNLLMLRDLTV